MSNVAQLDQQLNDAILTGKALEAFEQHYAENCRMTEADGESFVGKDVNRKREEAFFASIAEFHGAELVSSAVNGDTSFSEWKWDLTFKGGMRVLMEQVSVRTWQDGQVTAERFYYNKG